MKSLIRLVILAAAIVGGYYWYSNKNSEEPVTIDGMAEKVADDLTAPIDRVKAISKGAEDAARKRLGKAEGVDED